MFSSSSWPRRSPVSRFSLRHFQVRAGVFCVEAEERFRQLFHARTVVRGRAQVEEPHDHGAIARIDSSPSFERLLLAREIVQRVPRPRSPLRVSLLESPSLTAALAQPPLPR